MRATLGLALALAGGAVAAADPLRLPDLRVDAPGVPSAEHAAVHVVDGAMVSGGRGLHLGDALEAVPGVLVGNRANFAQGLRIAIRGFGARSAFGVRGIRVLLDEVPLTLTDGQTELDALDLGEIVSIHVSRGAAATRFGNAAGGVIAVHTRMPPPGTAQAGFGVGAFGYRRARLQGAIPAGDFGLSASLQQLALAGHRAHAHYRATLGGARLQGALAGGELALRAALLDAEALDPGGLTRAQRRDDPRQAAPRNLQYDAGEGIRQARLAASWWREHKGGTLGAFAQLARRDFANRLPFSGGGQVVLDRDAGGAGLLIERELAISGVRHWLSGGLDWQFQRDARRRFDNLDGQRGPLRLWQDERGDGVGLWLHDAMALGDATVSAGLRVDRLRLAVDDRFLGDGDDSGARHLDDWSASLGLLRALGAGWRWHARLATAYESPTFTELANPDGGGFNPTLRSARSRTLESGVDWRRGAWRAQLVAYRIALDDELLPFERDNQPGRTFYRNAGRSRHDGVELMLQAPLAPGLQLELAGSLGDYRFLRHEVDGQDLSGRRIPGVPRAFGHAALEASHGPWHGRLSAQFSGSRYADDANTARSGGHARIDLRLGWRGAALAVHGGVFNLLDRDYDDNLRINAFGGRHFEPAAPRSLWAAVQWQWGSTR